MEKRVRKAVIPMAGLGTRFLPATKAVPKEIFPIVDKPTIQYIVEEAVASGVENIIVVTGKGKRAIEDHFDRTIELEEILLEKQLYEKLSEIRKITSMADIHYIRQRAPLGLGHAVWCARRFIGNEPFAVLLGDDIVRSNVPCLKQLIDVYEKYEISTIGVQSVAGEAFSRYGAVAADRINSQVSRVQTIVEKPHVSLAPSTLTIIGRYVLSPTVFEFLEKAHLGSGGEIQLRDALVELNRVEGMVAYEFEGKRYDVGDKFGFLEATLELALEQPELRNFVTQLLKRIAVQDSSVIGA